MAVHQLSRPTPGPSPPDIDGNTTIGGTPEEQEALRLENRSGTRPNQQTEDNPWSTTPKRIANARMRGTRHGRIPKSNAHGSSEPDTLDEEEPYPNVVGTSDALVAVRDAEPYAPPTDPPVLPGGREGIDVATGFGFSADEESVREPAPRGDDDVLDQVLLVLRQDSITSTYTLDVVVDNGVVTIRGPIGSLDQG